MKYNFTLLKIVRTLLFTVCCMIGAAQAIAQSYTPSNVQTGGFYAGLTSDNSGNLYVVRRTSAGETTYQLEKWAGGNPASMTVLATGLRYAAYDYASSIAVNSTTGDVFYLNPDAGTGNAAQIMRIPGGVAGTATQVQVGRYFSAIALDNAGQLVTIEYNGVNYAVVRYNTTGTGSGTPLYSGLVVTSSPDGTSPWGLAVDRLTNDVYLTDTYPNSDQAGEPGLIKLTAPAFTRTNLQFGRHFTSLYVDGSSTLFAIEQASSGSANYKVMKYTNPAGTGTEIYPEAIPGGTALTSAFGVYPWGITGNSGGDIFVNDGFAVTPTGGRLLKLAAPVINVTSINRFTATPSNAPSVEFDVNFDGAATGVSTSNFAPGIASGSIVGASVTSITGSGNTRRVTVNTGTGNGTLRLDMVNVTGITPTVATTMPYQSGQTILIDKTAPTGTIAINNGDTYANAYGVTLNLTGVETGGADGLQMAFSVQGGAYSAFEAFATTKSVTLSGLDGTKSVSMQLRDAAGNVNTYSDDIILDRTAPETGIASGPDDPTNSTTATFDLFSDDAAATFELQLDGSAYSPVADPITFTGLAAGSHTINVRTIDPAGNMDLSPESYTWFIDLTPPAVSSVTVPANGTYGTGQQLNFTVIYDEAVTVTGAPSFPLTIGGTTVNATYVAAGSTSTNLIFRYTVQAGDFDNNGIAVSGPIALNGGTIMDAATNPANLTLNNIDLTTGVLVDAVGPVVTSVTVPADDTYIIGEALNFTVNFDESVTVTGTPSFPVTIGGNTVQATYVSGTGSNALLFRYIVQAGDSDDNGIEVGSAIALNGGTLRDALANNATLTLNTIGSTTGVLVDTRMPIPIISSSETFPVTGPFTITITFDMPVTGTLIAGEFTSLNATLSAVTQVNSTTWTALITPPPGQQNGSGSVRLGANAVTSAAGNNSMPSNTYNISWDTKVPAITVTPPANQYYKAGDVISFTISYDEDVIVTGAPTLPIIIGGTTHQAAYTAGADARTLIFSYTVAAAEQDLDGIDLDADIALNGGSIKDAAGNNAPTGVANHYAGILVDAVIPVVNSVDVPANGYYKAGQVLTFTVHTSENVIVTGTPTLDVVIGSATLKAAFTGGSGTNALTFEYTVVAGDNDMDGIAVGVLNPEGGTLRDPAGNNMVLTLNGVAPTTGVFVNTVIPTVTLSAPTVFNGPWDMTISFSEPVTGFTETDISVTNADLGSLTVVDSKTYTINIDPQADGTVTVSVPANGVVNIGGNPNTASNIITYTYDGTAPTVTSVAVPANGTYTNSDALNFIVNFSENVTVTGTPSLPVTIGATTVQATYTGGTGTNALTFSYSVQNGDYDVNGIAVGAAIALNGGTMQDDVTNNATLTLNNVGSTTAVLVDAVPPAITSVNVPANAYYNAGDVLIFTVDFNENVNVTGTPSVPVIIGATTVQASYTGGTGSNSLTFSYTVVAGDNDMDGIAVGGTLALNGGTVKDGLGNDAALALNSVGNTDNVFVNTIIPTVTLSGTPVLNGPWTMTITFSEAMINFAGSDISITNATTSAPVTSDNITYTVLVTPQANGPVSLSIPANIAEQQTGGNGNSASNPINYIFDGIAPTVTSVNVPTSGGYNAGDVLNFTVNFDENVAVTGTPSVPVTIGATTVQATYVSGSGTAALIFSYTIQNGENDPDGIALGAAIALNGGTIKDLSANDAVLTLNGIGNTSGVIVDAVAPVITSVTVPAAGHYKGGQQLNFTVHFSENVTPSAVPAVPVTIGSTVVEADYVSGSGTTGLLFTYTVQPGDADLDGITVGNSILLNLGTIKDGVGNDAVLALNNVGNTSGVIIYNLVPAVVLSGTPVLNGPWTMTITFSEAVTGFDLADISATNATLSTLSTSDNITYTALVTAGGDGAVSLSVPANIAMNIVNNGNTASNTLTYTHDGTAPFITAVNVPANGTYNSGDELTFTANFNENVTVTGTPSLPVQIGATVVQAAYTGGSGSSALNFSYTVLSGQEDNDGIGVGAALGLNSGTIKDAATNNAVLTLNAVGNTSAVLVDALAPVISSVTVPANGYYKAGDELNFTVQFSEPIVSAGSTATLPVTIGATTVQATIFSTPAPNSIVFRYVVQAGEVDLDGITAGTVLVPGGTAIRDAAGNNASLTLNNVGSTSNVFVLANRPTVDITGAISLTQPWTATITFSHAVTGFALTDITLINATASNLQTNDNITYTALISPVIEGGVSIEVQANVAQDIAGNQNLPSARTSYYYDPNPPVITSVEVPANGYYKQGDVLNFAVNWNEIVRNTLSPSSLTLPVIIGGTTVQAAYTGGFTTQRITFAYTVQAGEMDLDGIQLGTALQLTNATERILDQTGNNANLTLNNVANTSGVFVHTARPSATLSSAAATRVNAPFSVTLTFNEAVTQLALADFTLTNATVSSLQTTDNITYTVLVTPAADGAATISLPADAAVNVVGNGNTASNSITRTYDATPPAIAAGQSFTVSQYSAAGTVVGTVTATDASGAVQNWALATDGSGGALQISTAGVISVRNTALLDALVGTDVTLGVTASDGLNTSTAVPVTVRVVFVNQPPTLNAISNVTLCKDVQTHTIQLTGASATEPGQTYTITAASNRDIFDVLSVGAGDVLSYRLKADAPAGSATVAVTIRDNGGTTGGAVDSLRRTFTITVNALPVITITSDKGASISKGDIVKLTATGGSTYVWTAADGIISGQRTPVLEVRPMVNTTYEVTAASTAGCTATGSFALSVVTDFKVDATNILTPNGDGRNDRWVIRNLDSYQDNEVKIFDRAGRLIYSRKNYSNDWDGTVNGGPLAEGTYYYILTIQNGAKTATGYITIVRDRH